MAAKTFILGAGFSKLADFPLVRELKQLILRQVAGDWPHPGYRKEQFDEGLRAVDREGIEFEGLLIALRDRFGSAHVTPSVLRSTCARCFWNRQNALTDLPLEYKNFATWMRERNPSGGRNAIISLNWDLLAERALWDTEISWIYHAQWPSQVPILKPHGSINWSKHVKDGLIAQSSEWEPIAKGRSFCFRPSNPLSDAFADRVNEDLRYLIFPGDPEDEDEAKVIWAEAERAIQEREVAVFIGYRLPEYDSFATDFFRRAATGKRIEVYVSSPDVLRRYREVFGEIATEAPLRFENCPYARDHPHSETATAY